MQTSKWSNLRNQYLKVYQETIIDKLAYYTLHKTMNNAFLYYMFLSLHLSSLLLGWSVSSSPVGSVHLRLHNKSSQT